MRGDAEFTPISYYRAGVLPPALDNFNVYIMTVSAPDANGYVNFGPPFYPLEFILRDATGPDGAYIGNFGHATSVIVDYPFITGRSTSDSYLTGEKVVEVLEKGLRTWGFHAEGPTS